MEVLSPKQVAYFFPEKIAQAALQSLHEEFLRQGSPDFGPELYNRVHGLLLKHTDNALLQNLLRYFLLKPTKQEMRKKKHALDHYLHTSKKDAAAHGMTKIKQGAKVFAFSFSPLLLDILAGVKKEFKVHLLEQRPFHDGKLIAKKLEKHNIPVILFVDALARKAIENADICFLSGSYLTLAGEVIAAHGARLCVDIAQNASVPFYACMRGFDIITKKQRTMRQIDYILWENTPSNVQYSSLEKENIPSSHLTGIISELGILPPEEMLREARYHYKWLFS